MTTVYRFTIYDITTDNSVTSRRYGTREAIDAVRGVLLEQTAIEIDEADLGAEVPGMTVRNFNPERTVGFQKVVRT